MKKKQEFESVEKELKDLQTKILENKKEFQKLKDDGLEAAAATLEKEIQQQEKAAAIAKKGFDLIILTREKLDVQSPTKDIDEMTRVLLDIVHALREEPNYSEWILDDPAMIGLTVVGGTSVKLKVGVKTRPDNKFLVERELQRRIQGSSHEITAKRVTEESTPAMA